MGGLFSPPPPGSAYPDIPPTQWEPTGKQMAKGATKTSWWDDLVNKWRHSVWDGITWSISFLAGELDYVFAVGTTLLTALQATDQPGFFAMMAAVLGDLLGIEFDSGAIQSAFLRRGRIGAMTTAGGSLFDTLAHEFDPSAGAAQQVASDTPAKSFLGFLLEFSIRQGNVAFISELLPEEINVLGGLREYGEMLARNLGLGRLARRALQPLVQTLIADPLTWKLNQTYRPKLASEGLCVKAYIKGEITRDELNRLLSYQGYSDAAIQWLIAENTRSMHREELLSLWRQQILSDAEIIGQIQSTGVDNAAATQIWSAWTEEITRPLAHVFVTELLHQFHSGVLTLKAAEDTLQGLTTTGRPLLLTQGEVDGWKEIFGQLNELPRKLLSEGEIERAFLGGIVDMTTVQLHWQGLGYSTDAIQTLTLLLLQKQAAGNRTKPGHTPHKVLSEAQAEKAYHAGIIDLTQLVSYWHAMGYSPDDQLVLAALVQIKTPGPGTTTIPGATTP